ncbi:MAG: YggS family pyridoxal phosphate-dependent enzyme [Ruminococcaceae bacterium]|nr:YggS family pyridoxal phosphate-dependent enzyme [Oscillospiraceae bacterium]
MAAEITKDSYAQIADNIRAVREKIEQSAAQSPYDKEVTLMAVTKTVDADRINYAIDSCGIRCIGENRVQELCEKYPLLHLDGVSVHLIGSLQSNKVKYIADKVDLIHSLDSLSLAKEIDRQAKKHSRVIDCLIEINIGREEAKGGIEPTPDAILAFYDAVQCYENVRITGLMTIAPNCGTDDTARERYLAYFSETRRLFEQLCDQRLVSHTDLKPVLSMGMSGSYEAAILCGSDIVRVGSGIFGARTAAH